MPTIANNGYTPRWYQVDYHKAQDNGVKRAVIVFHRRAGKSVMLWNDTIGKAATKIGVYWYVLENVPMCKRIIWDNIVYVNGEPRKMLDFIPDGLLAKKNDTELQVELTNGSIIKLIGSVEFDRLRGANPIDVKFDEWQDQDPKVWDVIRPVLAQNGGTATFSGTPKGTNHLWETLQEAKRSGKWYADLKTAEDTHVISEEVLRQEKAEMPADMFDQEYLCKFIDGADTVFKDIENRVWNTQPDFGLGTYRLGFDPAGHGGDESVIAPLHEQSGCVDFLDCWQATPYDYTAMKLSVMSSKKSWNGKAPRVIMDSTGAGQALLDMMDVHNVQPFTFTEKSREALLRNLQVKLETGEVKIPNDQILIQQLKSFRYEQKGQKIRLQVPDGKHDDRAFAVALACWEYDKPKLSTTISTIRRKQSNIAPVYYR